MVCARLAETGVAAVDALARDAGVDRTEMLRRLLAYAVRKMPKGWKPVTTTWVSIDLVTSKLSELILYCPPEDLDGEPTFERVLLPGNSLVRVAGRPFRIPLGEQLIVQSPDLTYELVRQAPPQSRRPGTSTSRAAT